MELIKPVPHCRAVAKRYEKGVMILTLWAEAFHSDRTLTAVILDRLLNHDHILTLFGESYRLKDKSKSGVFRQNRKPG